MKTVVFVPGIMASVLETPEGKRVWPPKVGDLITGYDDIDLLLSEDLVAVEPIKRVAYFYSIYASLLEDLDACGYKTDGVEKRLVPFAYDWRRSNVDTAVLLANKLDAMHGDGELPGEIVLLGHSMGGLVLRYLIETPHFENRAWFSKISQLITLGTPHLGAAEALEQVAGKTKNLGLRAKDVKRLTNDPRYPSAFQLVPPEGNAQMVDVPPSGELATIKDSLDEELINAFQLNQNNVDAARSFWVELKRGKRPANINYMYFVGAAHKSPFRNDWDGTSDFSTRKSKSAGDGTVPISSALDTSVPHAFSMKKHSKIFEDRKLRMSLYKMLDAPSGMRPFAASDDAEVGDNDAIGLSLNKESYAIDEPMELAISFVTPIDNPSIRLQILKLDQDSGEIVKGIEPTIETEIRGVSVQDFAFEIVQSLVPGAYELRVLNTKVDDPEKTTFMIEAD